MIFTAKLNRMFEMYAFLFVVRHYQPSKEKSYKIHKIENNFSWKMCCPVFIAEVTKYMCFFDFWADNTLMTSLIYQTLTTSIDLAQVHMGQLFVAADST